MKWFVILSVIIAAGCAKEPVVEPQRKHYGFCEDGSKRIVAYAEVPYSLVMIDSVDTTLLYQGTGEWIGQPDMADGLIELRMLTEPLQDKECVLVYGCLSCYSTWTAVLRFIN